MKKILKKEVIISFIVGIIFASSIAVYASISASEVEYKNGQKVSQALDDLYTKADLTTRTQATATANDILSGKTAWVNGTQIQGTLPSTGKGVLWNAGKTNMKKVNGSNHISFDIGFEPSRCFVHMNNPGITDVVLMILNGNNGNYYCYNSGQDKSGAWSVWANSNWSMNNGVFTYYGYGDGDSNYNNIDIYWYAVK